MGIFSALFGGSDDGTPFEHMDASDTQEERDAEAIARYEKFSEALHDARQKPPLF